MAILFDGYFNFPKQYSHTTIKQSQFLKKALIFSLLINLLLVGALGYLVQRLGGLKFMVHRITAGGLAGVYENRKNLFEHLPLPKGSIIFLGDSITEYGQWEELINHPKVKNRGISGDTTWGLMRRLKGITASQPKAIFLMIGINDFLFTDEKEIVENYTKIVQQIKSETPNSQLFIQSVLPVNSAVKNTVFDNAAIVSLNKALQQIAKKEGLPYLNIHQQLLDDSGVLKAEYTADGVHINGGAYMVWKGIVSPHVNSLGFQPE